MFLNFNNSKNMSTIKDTHYLCWRKKPPKIRLCDKEVDKVEKKIKLVYHPYEDYELKDIFTVVSSLFIQPKSEQQLLNELKKSAENGKIHTKYKKFSHLNIAE